jgi:5-methylcytosine-specific restriction endonuclease McrA
MVLARDGWRCGCGARATRVHHVVALIDGGTDDMTNLRSVCVTCHGHAHPGRHH